MKRNQLFMISADLLLFVGTKNQLYWKQMLTLCQLLKMERVHLSHFCYNAVLMADRIPVIGHLTTEKRVAEKKSRNCMRPRL